MLPSHLDFCFGSFLSTSSVMTIFEKFRFVYRDFLSLERSFLVICRTVLVPFVAWSLFFTKISLKN
ncbi:hypothetical protein SD53_10725 [Rheinheimera mesophila]|nr:hypothetical protein SD53_10725 [Rheinheimera mesophila]